MEVTYKNIKGQIIECVEFTTEEFNHKFKEGSWKRQWETRDFLKNFGITESVDYCISAGSRSDIPSNIDAGWQEIAGIDVFMNKQNGQYKAAYHYPFYKVDNKIFMPLKPLKIYNEHYVKDQKDFEQKHDESRNYLINN